jgi:hypothetical protein
MKFFLKKTFIVVLIVVVTIFVVIFSKHKTDHSQQSNDSALVNEPRIPVTEEGRRALEEKYLLYAMDSYLLPYANIEISTINNIATSTDALGEHATLSLFPGQSLKNNGIRSQLSIDYPYKEGDIIEYSWEFKMPENFISDAPDNRWWVFADWHDQPDINKGETWETYQAHSSPIIFGYGNLEGKDFISLSTGIDGSAEGIVPRGLMPFKRNTWHHIRMIAKWSQEADGRVRVYFDGENKPLFDVSGPNMLNAYQHYMKVGQYRHPEIQTENTIAIKNISIMKR